MLKVAYKLVTLAFVSVIIFTSQPVFANCKQEVDALAKAQDQRNAACNAASQSLADKNLEDLKKGDSQCRKKQKALEAANKRLQACTNR